MLKCAIQFFCNVRGMKHFAPPIIYNDFEQVERPKLRVMERMPQYPPNLRPPKMQKKLKFMRGPELIHNKLLHKQYGIIATGGGRLRWGHFEMLRLTIGRKMDVSKMFAIWRVPAPWQPVTKKGQGQRMGGGKGAIDHYVTPVKAGRVILEISGKCEFNEVKPFLQQVCNILPFDAEVISEEIIQDRLLEQKCLNQENQNPFTTKYAIQNNLNGCHRWISPVDHKWFGKN
ncbi:large ribosomal subunit protein uL16m [Stomoxys calcitrans]|uniref:Large ribosomal subunit protein uL16m n=1 Tax=Stomoxys calcitrans TaxID=35570 RepID=A0A1I8NRX5_STOCA|nr:large ribosomal subunit protein uL16m [Stomoxys calcitrans]